MLYPIELRAQRRQRTARFGLGEIRHEGQTGQAFDEVHAGIPLIQRRVVVVFWVVVVVGIAVVLGLVTGAAVVAGAS